MRKEPKAVLPAIAEWVESVSYDALSDAVVEQTKLLVLDTIGCAIAALDENDPRAVVEAALELGGTPQASIIGSPGKTSVTNAVFANGVLLRFLDLNDFFVVRVGEDTTIGGHPSDNIPVALAVGEWRGCHGRDVIAAIVMGYEIYARMKSLMESSGPWDGTTVSGFVAPAVAGRLIGLDRDRLADAIALGAARSPTPAVMRAGDISAGKNLANALIAQSGTLCAMLAAHGLTGPLAVLEHERGLKQVFPNRDDDGSLTAPLADDCAIMGVKVKAYPCVATSQTLVAAALKVHDELDGGLEGIESITITMADTATVRDHQSDPGRLDPHSRESADHSFSFLAAVALADGALTPSQFENSRWDDPAIRTVMSRTTMTTDAALNQRDPEGYPCLLEVATRTGTVHRVAVDRPPGVSDKGLDAAEVVEKFNAVTQGFVSDDDRNTIRNLVLDLDTAASIAPLMERLSACRAEGR